MRAATSWFTGLSSASRMRSGCRDASVGSSVGKRRTTSRRSRAPPNTRSMARNNVAGFTGLASTAANADVSKPRPRSPERTQHDHRRRAGPKHGAQLAAPVPPHPCRACGSRAPRGQSACPARRDGAPPAPRRPARPWPPALKLAAQDIAIRGVVVHDEHRAAVEGLVRHRKQLRRRLLRLPTSTVKPNVDPLPDFALHPHRAAHHFGDPLADGQPSPVPP